MLGIILNLIAEAIPGSFDWQVLLKEVGLPICLVVFFLWRDMEREKKNREALAQKDAFIQEKLMSVVQDMKSALTENTGAYKIQKKVLDNRPCIRGKLREAEDEKRDGG